MVMKRVVLRHPKRCFSLHQLAQRPTMSPHFERGKIRPNPNAPQLRLLLLFSVETGAAMGACVGSTTRQEQQLVQQLEKQ
jgi:hypothetical protein